MNRTRLLFIGILALALGGLLSAFVYKTLQARTTPPARAGVEVAVAANDIAVGARIEDKDLKMVAFPGEDLPAGVFHSKSKLIGRGAVLPITRGEFILTNKVAAENAGAGMPAMIPKGMRAVSVRVNEVVSVAGFVVPGTRVDVLLTGTPAGGASQTETTTVLQNVAVLASGQKLERNSAGEPQTAPVITLLVSPEDAQRLTLASSDGRIQLALRNPLDTDQTKPPSVRNDALYGGSTPPPARVKPVKVRPATSPAPAHPTTYSIEVIRGNEKKSVDFDQQ
jgi:pilus assembly protein CpaB